jgi:hypothetical protein
MFLKHVRVARASRCGDGPKATKAMALGVGRKSSYTPCICFIAQQTLR